MNIKLLKSQMALKDKKVSSLANGLGISKSAFYRKLNCRSEFTRREISGLMCLLDIEKEKAFKIFFDDFVS